MKNLIKKWEDEQEQLQFILDNPESYEPYMLDFANMELKKNDIFLADLKALEKQHGDMERLLIENEKMGEYIKTIEKKHDEDMVEFASKAIWKSLKEPETFCKTDVIKMLKQFKEQQ